MKIITSVFFLIFLGVSTANSEETFSNYNKYSLTKTKFKLNKIAKEFNHPWALTFINEKNLIVTEKNGGIFKVNVDTGFKQPITHAIEHTSYDGGGPGCLLYTSPSPRDRTRARMPSSA